MRYNDGSAYLRKLAESLAEGNVRHLHANLSRLKTLVARLQGSRSEIDALLAQAGPIIDIADRTADT